MPAGPADNTPYLFITTVIVPLSGIIGVGIKMLYDHLTKKRAEKVDDGTQLRKDLIEERKVLLSQLLSERSFYADRIKHLEERVWSIEDEGRKKDDRILELQGKLNEQALQLNSQHELISILQSGNTNEPAPKNHTQ